MEMDMAKLHTSQQDTELIDILWRQDVDLGAGREVFDFSYRQKEVELRRRREQEEEELQRRLREREKALLAQLQLDEETGEFVPRSEPAASQNVAFPLEAGDTMSFDECMQLLAETFPLEEPSQVTDQSAPPPLDPASDRSPPAPLDLAWMELLSLPELQQCLALPMQENLDALFNPSPPADTPEPNFRQFLSDVDPLSSSHLEVCPPEYISSYSGSFSSTTSPNLSQMSLNGPSMAPDFIAEEFGQLFYPEAETPVETTDLRSFSPGNPELGAEFPDSDSGLSLDASSPGKSLQGNESAGFSDSDSEDTGSPGSAESDCAEMFPLVCFTEGSFTSLAENESPEPPLTNPKFEPVEAGGHSKPPFTKDKQKKRSEARLSRDEQRAKALRIPFTVDMIINLPVDDFNEMMSKHQLNEAQLALVRDIRRRGKNKVAAQNCRKRKLENIVGLEYELDSLKEEKERLTEEKSRRAAGLKEMKHQLSALYQEVFSRLRDERGKPFSPDQYSLQHTADGAVFLVPRLKKAALKSD